MEQRGFGDLHAVAMDCVWDCAGSITVRDGFDEISRKRQSYTTVMPTMDNLYREGRPRTQRRGSGCVYPASMGHEGCSAQLMRAAVAYGGDASAVLGFVVDQMSAERSAQLKAATCRGRR
ncbi:putative transcriptional regulator [Mycobacterium sp. BK558]|jgi:predicted transcriptional regulator|uniref:BlaI/MecI/CopY family transcriptional regulator n=1 Tax=Mycolicibacterium sp. D5.8-2 TaxID=3085903 RepID=UPI00102CF353|nr:BlaI/MecI/CopY family transcriptional regulator [Mycolicibacterium sp. D5.8-2]MDW5613900.1 BlaI/MecI/CopY family transcriptional regulator [Mycolicibacterium sp. D5.8-2]RZT11548.1 putative transcriptional regulator [Mycobacterium sp. BK558]